MDKTPSASRVQSAPKPRLATPPPQEPSPLLPLLHLSLTGFLAVAMLTVCGLLAAGILRVGGAGPATSETRPDDKDGKADKKDDGEKGKGEKEKPKEGEGRYQIEPQDDMVALMNRAGPLGFFGEPVSEAWVYRYKGGYVQCHLEVETYGKAVKGPPVPDNWPALLSGDAPVQQGQADALNKEGYIVLSALRPTLAINEALEPYHTHLGGLFVSGPAGPLHRLTTTHLDSSHWRFYRILLTAGAPRGKTGPGFNTFTTHNFNARQYLVPRDPGTEKMNIGGGKDLVPGQEITLLACQRGHTRIRLKAKFLPDAELKELASKPAPRPMP